MLKKAEHAAILSKSVYINNANHSKNIYKFLDHIKNIYGETRNVWAGISRHLL